MAGCWSPYRTPYALNVQDGVSAHKLRHSVAYRMLHDYDGYYTLRRLQSVTA